MQKMDLSGCLKGLCLIGLVIALTACQGYRDGKNRTFGQFTDDAGIQASVKTTLMRDKEINGLSINVEVNRNIVSLYGRIPSEYARAKALRLAATVRGVERVEDRLTLIE